MAKKDCCLITKVLRDSNTELKNSSRWYELELHNDILISSLFFIILIVVVREEPLRVAIHWAAVQYATG